jgi:hypothetical protein
MGNGYEPITDEDERAAVRAQAVKVVMKSVAATVVVMALLLLTL